MLSNYYEMSYGLNVEMHKQTEIAKRLNAIIAQLMPFLSQEHQQQVATAVERAKQVTMSELNAVIGICAEDNRLMEMTPVGCQRGLIPQRVQNGRDTGTIFEY
ncbi:hypothetical protein HUJ04_010840 [Dendroctonus ponderosae]|nr:hypothetical protein HUJ04_010840 [Dendroctonus ponderosae]